MKHLLSLIPLTLVLGAFLGACDDSVDSGGGGGQDGQLAQGGDGPESARCEADESVIRGVCVPCPDGASNEPGDDPSGEDTECEGNTCGADEHVVDHECQACPDDAANEPGDDTSGEDTACDEPCFVAFGLRCDAFNEAYLKPDAPDTELQFGTSVALSGNTLVVGTPYEDSGSIGVNGAPTDTEAFSSGAVYVFVRSGSGWTQQAYIKASNTDEVDYFGTSVALDGDTLVVGASQEDSAATGVDGDSADDTAEDSGAAYVFVRNGSTWTQQAYLKASNTEAYDGFGADVAIDGDTVAIGAPEESSGSSGVDGDQANDDTPWSGAVYVFVRTGSTWAQQAYVKSSAPYSDGWFGYSVALSGNTLAVGAEQSGVGGEVDVYSRSGSAWTHEAHLMSDPTRGGDSFGASVSLDGDTLAVGAPGENSAGQGIHANPLSNGANNSGAVYVFTRTASVWTLHTYIKASNTDEWDRFGTAVSLDGDTLAVGARGEGGTAVNVNGDESSNGAAMSGAVFLFSRVDHAWTQKAYIKSSHPDAGDEFGTSVAVSGDLLAVGAIGEDGADAGVDGDPSDNGQSSTGAVYVRRLAP